MDEEDKLKRAEMVIEMAKKLGSTFYITPRDIVSGNSKYFSFLLLHKNILSSEAQSCLYRGYIQQLQKFERKPRSEMEDPS